MEMKPKNGKNKIKMEIRECTKRNETIDEDDVDDDDEDDDMVDRNINRLHLLHRQNVRMPMKLRKRERKRAKEKERETERRTPTCKEI